MANILNSMRFGRAFFLLAGGFLLLLGAADAAARAQMPIEKIVIETARGPRTFRVEVAADDAARERGLMHRTYLAPDAGMLFDFKKNVMTAFWMKDTPVPLDLLFVRADGTVSTVAANAVPFSTAEIVSAEPIRAVIEIGGGVSRKLGIAPGNHVRASIFVGAKAQWGRKNLPISK